VKRIAYRAFGEPAKVCQVEEVPEPTSPGRGEVLVETLAFPVNPSDLLRIEGRHRQRPPFPAQPGSEAVVRVLAVGGGVSGFAVGDVAVPMLTESWIQRRVLPASSLLAVDQGADPQQLSMLRGLPGTAWYMLEDHAPRVPGSWVLQTAANSGVGLALATLARDRGLRTANIVRRKDAMPAVLRAGGDVALLAEPHDTLAERVLAATGGARPMAAFDAVAGPATRAIAGCLADHAPIVVYGVLSGLPCEITAQQLIFHNLSMVGYSLPAAIARRAFEVVQRDYLALSRLVAAGRLSIPILATYPLMAISTALRHAAEDGRDGKILVLANA
jgi:NADPH:quinone reductase-like Zn-dependent oxidoreductase